MSFYMSLYFLLWVASIYPFFFHLGMKKKDYSHHVHQEDKVLLNAFYPFVLLTSYKKSSKRMKGWNLNESMKTTQNNESDVSTDY